MQFVKHVQLSSRRGDFSQAVSNKYGQIGYISLPASISNVLCSVPDYPRSLGKVSAGSPKESTGYKVGMVKKMVVMFWRALVRKNFNAASTVNFRENRSTEISYTQTIV